MEDKDPVKEKESMDNTKPTEVPKKAQPGKPESSSEISGPSGQSDKLQIIDITDDTSNSSHASDLPSKPIVIEPDDIPLAKIIPKSTDIVEISDSNDATDNTVHIEKTSSDTSQLEKIPEEVEYVSVDNPKDGDLLENENIECSNLDSEKIENVIENSGDLSETVHEVSVIDIVQNKQISESHRGIESEMALLEKSGDETLDSVEQKDSEPVTNGIDNTNSTEGKGKKQSPVKDKKQLKIPPHLIGRNLEKPVEIIKNGRVTLKPRLGVKVPNKNLSSQIVSKQDITDELMERSRQRHASLEPSENIVFAKKMTNRLASKILSPGGTKLGTTGSPSVAVTSSVSVPPSNERIANNSDLIALLEGDDDADWSVGTSKKSPVKNTDWERETALKQLNDLPRLSKKDLDDEPRLSLNPVIKTYTRKRKPSEDIKAILEGAKKSSTTPLKTLPNKVIPGSPNLNKTQKLNTPKQDEKIKNIQADTKKSNLDQKNSTSNSFTSQKLEVKQKLPSTPEKTGNVLKAVESPKTPPQKQIKISSIQKSIQNIRNLSAPHTKLSSDKKALIILSSPESENKKLLTKSGTKTLAVKKPLSPNTYISKSLRIIKRKKIWDPDEATPTKLVKTVRQIEAIVNETKPTPEKKQSLERKSIETSAKKIFKKALIKRKKPKLTEIDRLLGDEGAVNMLYSVRNSESIRKKNKGIISLEKAERELLNRTKEIKSDLLHKNTTEKESPIGLRKKAAPFPTKPYIKDPAAIILNRKKSKDSTTEDSVHINTPPSSPAYTFHSNVSRIIRRHSSSSFSSKESDDGNDRENDAAPRKKKEKQRKNSVASATIDQNKIVNETVIDDSELSKFESFNVRRFNHLVQIILVPTSANGHITLSLKVLNELSALLKLLETDSACRVVVVSSTGNSFCLGIDYKELVASTPKERSNITKQLAEAVRSFLLALSKFPKVIVAGVHGNALGLGVTMLPLFDMVLASDTATFSTQYTRLGCAAEGGALLKLPHVMHNALASELFFASRILTAAEALRLGLVTRTLWPDKFQEELISILKIISSQSLQSMEAIKKQLRHQLLTSVEPALKMETNILVQHWTSDECQKSFAKFSFESK